MNAIVTHDEAPRLPSLQSGGAVRAIVPQDFDGAWRIANAVVKAGMAPAGLETPEKAMVAIMHGMEVGMTPMAALQSIAVVNGRATIWGDGAIGLVRASGKCEWIKERMDGEGEGRIAVCEVKRKGEHEPTIGRFSVKDAQTAGLWTKTGPWKQYPERMLKMRARAFALRDAFADVLRGLGIAEEVQDFQPIRDITPTSPQPPRPPAPPSATVEQIDVITADGEVVEAVQEVDEREIVTETGEATDAIIPQESEFDTTAFFEELETSLAAETTMEGVEERWNEFDPLAQFDGDDVNQGIAKAIKARRLKAIGG
jgi:hypothetical protein